VVLGYGSNFGGYSKNTKDSVWDTIVVVKDTEEFHRVNIQNRPKDYWRLLRRARVQAKLNRWGMNYIQSEGKNGAKFKYPVVALDDLEADCQNSRWSNYVAGRLQKSFQIIHTSGEEKVLNSFRAAVAAARSRGALEGVLTLVSGKFSFDVFLQSVVKLSYRSDWRPEDPKKIEKIVNNTREALTEIYQPLLAELVEKASFLQTSGADFISSLSRKHCREARLKLFDMKPVTAIRNYVKNPFSNKKFITYGLAKLKKWHRGLRKQK
jgi:hypothetical protein